MSSNEDPTDAVKLLPLNATGTGAGTWYENRNHTRSINATFSVLTTGTPSAVVIVIEGEIDGMGAFPMATHTFTAAQITAELAAFSLAGIRADRIRYNVTTFTSGTNINTSVVFN